MEIGGFKHKGLRRFYEDDDASYLPAAAAKKIRRILAALAFADDLSQMRTIPGWRLHALKGKRKGVYSVTVTGNWRLTFRVQGRVIRELDFEDYH